MTNRQWLLEKMQNMSDETFAEIIVKLDGYKRCEFCNLDKGIDNCRISDCLIGITDWLKAEHKEPIKLSDTERVILENMDENYKWIARDDDTGHLHIYIEKPIRIGKEKYWSVDMDDDYKAISFYDNLFKFIKGDDNKPYNIEELLKGE